MADDEQKLSDSNFALIRDGVASYLKDSDPEETQEWMDSLDALLEAAYPERGRYLMLRLLERATAKRVALPPLVSTDYVNTIPTNMEPDFLETRRSRSVTAGGFVGMLRSWCTVHNAPVSVWVATFLPTLVRRHYTRWG